MDELLVLLHAIYPLTRALRKDLKKTVRFRTLSKNEFLLKEGKIHKEICFVKKGLLRCYYIKDGEEVSVWFMREGDICVSIESFYLQLKGDENIQAVEECELIYISYAELQYLFKCHVTFNIHGRILTQKYLIAWDRQIRNIRKLTALERFEFLLEHNPILLQRVPGTYLASYLDIDRTTFARMKGKIARKKGKGKKANPGGV